jgi:hypothetical protein
MFSSVPSFKYSLNLVNDCLYMLPSPLPPIENQIKQNSSLIDKLVFNDLQNSASITVLPLPVGAIKLNSYKSPLLDQSSLNL